MYMFQPVGAMLFELPELVYRTLFLHLGAGERYALSQVSRAAADIVDQMKSCVYQGGDETLYINHITTPNEICLVDVEVRFGHVSRSFQMYDGLDAQWVRDSYPPEMDAFVEALIDRFGPNINHVDFKGRDGAYNTPDGRFKAKYDFLLPSLHTQLARLRNLRCIHFFATRFRDDLTEYSGCPQLADGISVDIFDNLLPQHIVAYARWMSKALRSMNELSARLMTMYFDGVECLADALDETELHIHKIVLHICTHTSLAALPNMAEHCDELTVYYSTISELTGELQPTQLSAEAREEMADYLDDLQYVHNLTEFFILPIDVRKRVDFQFWQTAFEAMLQNPTVKLHVACMPYDAARQARAIQRFSSLVSHERVSLVEGLMSHEELMDMERDEEEEAETRRLHEETKAHLQRGHPPLPDDCCLM